VDYNDLDAIKKAYNKNTCAVMLEVVQGEGGVNIPDASYLPAVQAFCRENKLLLIIDEVQTGIGRLGTLFGYEQFGIEPDVMTLAKGLGGGVPIGAIMVKDQFNVFAPGDHGSTFGGNPLATAAGYATVKYVIENDVSAHAKRVGAYMMQQLGKLKRKHDFITDVRGRGLLIAVEFNANISGDVVTACLNSGFLVNPVRPNALRFMPPLIITEKEVDEAVGILDQVLAAVKKPTPTTT
jgi:acetylornithine/succinyldiaminopimelate/putrescine aminotransferase